jgi:dTDP-4-dehydrorhamnose reductase
VKILVLGGSGLIGNFFIRNSINHEIITTFNKTKINTSNVISKKINLPEDWAKLQNLILEKKPDVVLNSMGFPNSDFCETNKEEVYALHVKVSEKITALCSKINSKIVFLSTEYVFDGKKGNYTENDETNPINYYGHSKDLAEKITLKNENNLVLRTAMVYGLSSKVRFLRYVIENLRKNQEINTYDDIFNSATLLDDLANGISKAIKFDANGIYHMVGSSCVSRFDFAKTVAKVFNFNENLIKPASIVSAKLKAKRPVNTCLNNSKAVKTFNIKFSSINEGIKRVYERRDKPDMFNI